MHIYEVTLTQVSTITHLIKAETEQDAIDRMAKKDTSKGQQTVIVYEPEIKSNTFNAVRVK